MPSRANRQAIAIRPRRTVLCRRRRAAWARLRRSCSCCSGRERLIGRASWQVQAASQRPVSKVRFATQQLCSGGLLLVSGTESLARLLPMEPSWISHARSIHDLRRGRPRSRTSSSGCRAEGSRSRRARRKRSMQRSGGGGQSASLQILATGSRSGRSRRGVGWAERLENALAARCHQAHLRRCGDGPSGRLRPRHFGVRSRVRPRRDRFE